MPTKTTKKQKPIIFSVRQWIKPVLAILLVMTLLVYGIVLSFLVSARPVEDNQRLSTLILQAVDRVNHPLPIDAPSGKVYFAAAKLSLPAVPTTLGELVYTYSFSDGASIDGLHLASLSDIRMREGPITNYSHDSKAMFDQVPKLQACARGIALNFQASEDQSPVATKQLADGRTLYFYTEPLCENAELLEYAQQIQSY